MKKLNTKYFTISVYALAVFAFSILLLLFCLNLGTVFGVIDSFVSGIGSILYAILFAFLLLPAVRRFDSLYGKLFCRKKEHPYVVSGFSISTTFLLAFALVAVTLAGIIPTLIKNLEEFAVFLQEAARSLDTFVASQAERFPWLAEYYAKAIDFLSDPTALSTLFGGSFGSALSSTTSFFSAIISQASNIFLGLILSVYLLASRKGISSICGKIVVAFVPMKHVNKFVMFFKRLYTDFCTFAFNRVFVTFLFSAAVFIICLLLGIPATSVVVLLIFITHLIPVVGPILGTTLSILFVFLIAPNRGLAFMLLLLALEILSTNLFLPYFLPRKLRPSFGLTAVLVLLGFTLLGAIGAFLAVPVYASLSIEFREILARRLARKKLPIPAKAYESFDFEAHVESESARLADESEQTENTCEASADDAHTERTSDGEQEETATSSETSEE